MSVKSYLIAPFQTGLEKDKQPWLLTEDAFEILEDAYIWRGRVKKRYGTSLIGSDYLTSRLRINLGNTGVSPFAGNVPAAPSTGFTGQQLFSIGSVILTCNSPGTPATLLSTDGSYSGTFDTTTGAYSITHPAIAATPVYYYPGTPVMGLKTRELVNINQESTIAFDLQFSYERVAGGWDRLGTAIWTGNDTDFFWTCNYRGQNPYETFFYVTNFNVADNIKYILQGSTTWNNLRPQLDIGATRYLETCLIILPFKDRLVALNTIEDESGNDRTYPNRCRFSQNGDPRNNTNSWLDDTPGRGGFIDAPTKESIVTAQTLKDRLIVYFERSTWELVYTNNESLPFRWQKINRELGAESTFSQIPFDRGLVGIGNVGVHTCNGVNVDRIDEKIPFEVFKIHNGNDGTKRVYGIRDFYNEIVLWTFPDQDPNPIYPNRILIYNYRNNSWAFFNDSFTCFGYYQEISDITWTDLGRIYGTWENWTDPWNSAYSQSGTPWIIAGNQQGMTLLLNSDKTANDQSLYIYDITAGTPTSLQINNHNLKVGDYVLIEDAIGITSLNNNIYRIENVIDNNNVTLSDSSSSGTYLGGGKVLRISNLNLWTKKFNPGTPVGQQFNIPYIDFLLTRTTEGQISIDTYIDQFDGQSIREQDISNSSFGSKILTTSPESLFPMQQLSEKIWHRFFSSSLAQFLQLRFYMSDDQMKNYNIATSNFILDAIILYAKPQGRLIG